MKVGRKLRTEWVRLWPRQLTKLQCRCESCASCKFPFCREQRMVVDIELWTECPERNECHCAVRSINYTSFVTSTLLDARKCQLHEVKIYCSASRIIAFSCAPASLYKNVHRIEPTLILHDTSHFVCNENFEFRIPTGSKFSPMHEHERTSHPSTKVFQ